MNLAKLFEMQKVLDEHIMTEHPELRGQNNLDWKILALQVELGECANEWRGFKKWSKNQKPRLEVKCHACKGLGEFHQQLFSGPYHIDDKVEVCLYCNGSGIQERPLLEEYVDCLHFILSIGLEIKTDVGNIVLSYKCFNTTEQFNSVFEGIGMFRKSINEDYEIDEQLEQYENVFSGFIGLGKMLGFTWEQIEQAYIDKNKVNHQRQTEGY